MSPFLDLEPWPRGAFEFETPLPGSKSLTLRDCAIAALADGVSTVRFPGEADDYWRMKDCLRRLGIDVDDSRDDEVRIAGRGGSFAEGVDRAGSDVAVHDADGAERERPEGGGLGRGVFEGPAEEG